MTDVDGNQKEFFVGNITIETFLRDYWRRKPLFVKSGARQILDTTFTEEKFEAILKDLRGDPTTTIKERVGEVAFVEGFSRHVPELAQLANRLAVTLGVPTAWFDGVRTYQVSGIGSHFDHSDNFVLQQSGVKRWAVSSPEPLPRHEVAKRMLQMPEVGSTPLSQTGFQEFVLEPGDLLYLPLLWVHSGVSEGSSVSVSLVCPAIPMQTLFLRGVQKLMRDHLLGHQAAPSMHPFRSPDERTQQAEMLRSINRTLLSKLSSDEALNEIVDRQLAYLGREGLKSGFSNTNEI